MPGGDGTGPGWAGGNWMCRRGFGRGFGRGYGRGFGRGMGRGFGMGFGRGGYAMQQGPYQQYTPYAPPAPTKEEEKNELKEYVMELETELKEAKRRILELGGSK